MIISCICPLLAVSVPLRNIFLLQTQPMWSLHYSLHRSALLAPRRLARNRLSFRLPHPTHYIPELRILFLHRSIQALTHHPTQISTFFNIGETCLPGLAWNVGPLVLTQVLRLQKAAMLPGFIYCTGMVPVILRSKVGLNDRIFF